MPMNIEQTINLSPVTRNVTNSHNQYPYSITTRRSSKRSQGLSMLKYSDASSSRSESTHSWSLQLDQDLLDTIAAIYPEWFKGYSHSRAVMPEGASPAPTASQPTTKLDSSPLQLQHTTMDKNKESLKVKLMMRRPINQLVAQGILPSLKTPPAFHEQRQKLERAKTGDLLKAKIQKRPDRDELVRQHILEADMGHVDPSLAERQRMLKKARLADSLNDQLSHRPGPLELIQKNILHTEEPIERAVKEGVIPFKATSEGLRKAHHPDHYVTFEEDSQSSENSQNSLPPLESAVLKTRDVLETAAASAGIVTVAVIQPFTAEICSPLSLGSSTSSLSPLSSVASPPTPLTPRPPPLASPAPGKADKNRKKSKTKAQTKARTIKFHEYKGPPSAQKLSNLNNNSNETSYELLLHQQQLFLQWQLELQHKYPQIILPASQKPQPEVTQIPTTTTLMVTTSPAPAPPPPSPPQLPPVDSPKYQDMKVSDLKEELKKRNLPVSGAKPQLIERLRGMSSSLSNVGDMEGCESLGGDEGLSSLPPSPAPSAMDTSEPSPPPSPNMGETILQQQRKIEELQRELMRSKQQLMMQIQKKNTPTPTPTPVATPAPATTPTPTPVQTIQALPTTIPIKAIIQNGMLHINDKLFSVTQQTNQISNVNVKASLAARITQHQAQKQVNELLKNKILVPVEVKNCQPAAPPPVYEEATKIIKQEPVEQKYVKNQMVDDLLEILIKNGELPASAAQDPITPNSSANNITQLPVFPEPAPYPGPFIENMATDFPEVSNNNSSDHNFHSNGLDFFLNQELSTDYCNSNGNVHSKDLELSLDSMDLEEMVNNNTDLCTAMDMDDSWLSGLNGSTDQSQSDVRLYDPLISCAQNPLDLFNLEDNDIKFSSMSWEKGDFAT